MHVQIFLLELELLSEFDNFSNTHFLKIELTDIFIVLDIALPKDTTPNSLL